MDKSKVSRFLWPTLYIGTGLMSSFADWGCSTGIHAFSKTNNRNNKTFAQQHSAIASEVLMMML